MIGLVRAEFRRLLSRRLFWLLGALLVLGILAASIITFITSSKDPDAGVARARQEVATCERFRSEFRQSNPNAEKGEFSCPTVEDLSRQFDERFRYADTMPNATRGVAAALLILAFAVGASFVGAEWGTGSMSTWLTWEPRRGRVLAGKAIACAASVAIVTVVALALLDLLYLPVGSLRGTLEGTTPALWRTLSGIWLRGAGLAAFGSLIAIGLAMLVRNTAGSVVIGIVYGGFVDQLFSAVWQGRFRGWLLTYNIARLLGFPVPPANDNRFDGAAADLTTLSVNRPLILFSIYAAGLLALAYAAFRARDVT